MQLVYLTSRKPQAGDRVLGCIMLGSGLGARGADGRISADLSRSQLSALRLGSQQISDLSSGLSDLSSGLSDLSSDLSDLRSELLNISSQFADLSSELSDLRCHLKLILTF